MCGIIGYVGKNNVIPILVDGLKKLEYRGYDSAGLAVISRIKPFKIAFVKTKGRVKDLENKLCLKCDRTRNIQNIIKNAYIGIAHTRWATHGEPSERNAHPHTDCSGRVFVCHNGIVENYKELKETLIRRGHKFKSETDTEVLAHLIEENLRYAKKENNLKEVFIRALKKVKGAYGIAVMLADWPDKIIAARNSSPLIIGLGKDENIIASDASAILERTRNVIYMNDDEAAIVTSDNVEFFNILSMRDMPLMKKISKYSNTSKSKDFPPKADQPQAENISDRKEKLDWDIQEVQKSGYPHFMLKEIFEQPESLTNSLRGRVIKDKGLAKLGGLETVKNQLKDLNRLIITGCGTAYLAGAVGKLMIEELAGIPCEVETASELRYRPVVEYRQNLAMVAISQSGETADTLAALRKIKERGVITLGIVNTVGSTIARETDAGVYNHAGPEIGMASTKAFTSQLMVLALLALFLGRQRNYISPSTGKKIVSELIKIPELVKITLKQNNKVQLIAKKYSAFARSPSVYAGASAPRSRSKGFLRFPTTNGKDYNNFLYIGRKYNFPTALEGALKLKEISYIHAEGYGAGEMKHGPIAMIDENFPTIAIAPVDSDGNVGVDSVYDKMASNMEEIKARRGKIIAITTEGNEKIKHIADDWLYIPKTLEMLTPILAVIPLQLFAYYMGVFRGLDVDKPRNLAKSVTVE